MVDMPRLEDHLDHLDHLAHLEAIRKAWEGISPTTWLSIAEGALYSPQTDKDTKVVIAGLMIVVKGLQELGVHGNDEG